MIIGESLAAVIQAAAKTNTNVRVLSNSWSVGSFSQALLDEIKRADAQNMLFVASAGNSGKDSDATPKRTFVTTRIW